MAGCLLILAGLVAAAQAVTQPVITTFSDGQGQGLRLKTTAGPNADPLTVVELSAAGNVLLNGTDILKAVGDIQNSIRRKKFTLTGAHPTIAVNYGRNLQKVAGPNGWSTAIVSQGFTTGVHFWFDSLACAASGFHVQRVQGRVGHSYRLSLCR
jgi:hypothetical protein